jgi:uncharacterized protein with NRDE domain
MCLIVFAYQVHPQYPLVLVANRDEYYQRPTRPAMWWPEVPGMLAGRDLQAGGTWLGVNASGGWAAVTNFREGSSRPASRTRGELVSGFLGQHRTTPINYVTPLVENGQQYGGYNLIAGNLTEAAYHSNRGSAPLSLKPGAFTLSNHLLNTPWPKSEQGRFKLEHVLRQQTLTVESLLTVLADREPFDDHHLPHTGVGLAMERLLSPPFIAGEDYGTRCTTVLLVSRSGEVIFAEQNFEQGEKKGSLRLFEFVAEDW